MKKICTPNESEKEQLKNIWKLCFDESDDYVEWFFKTMYTPDNTLCLKSDGIIESMMMLFKQQYVFCGKRISACFIGGVATLPPFRGEGNITKLMERCFHITEPMNFDIASLIPVNASFYTQYGFETVSDIFVYSGNSYNLSGSKKEDDAFAFEPTYGDFCSRFDFYEYRNDKSFSLICEEAAASENSIYRVPGAYMNYSIENGVLNCSEFVYANNSGVLNLLTFIKNNSKKFFIKGDKNLRYFFGTEIRKEPYMMIKPLRRGLKIKKSDNNFFNMTIWT